LTGARSGARPAAAGAARITLKAGKDRPVLRRHPWIYAAAIARVEGDPEPGAVVAVHDAQGRRLAWAGYSPASLLRARCWTFEPEAAPDADLVTARVRAAVARRAALGEHTDAVRLVFGEADGLPGLVADRYGDLLVVQFHAAALEPWRAPLLAALREASGCTRMLDRSDPSLREREGLTPSVEEGGTGGGRCQVREHGMLLEVDTRRGHKTGFYIDQRDNRHLLAQIVAGQVRAGRPPAVLNAFCYTGAFSVAAARAGAQRVRSVDSSADALALGERNASLNRSDAQMQWVCADVFAELRALREAGARFDVIVLDPPKFATNAHQVERAARAYKDINLGALRLLAPGGALLTFSCSGAVDAELFRKIVAGALADAGGDALVRGRLGAGADHPVSLSFPEGDYLKGLWLERC
jgi:23S rRNA (cytosine1962-C5)-methyltransferase